MARHDRERRSRWTAAAFGATTLVAGLHGQDAASVFAQHREDVLKGGVLTRGGYTFAVASSDFVSSRKDMAEEKTRMAAIALLIDAATVVEPLPNQSLAGLYDRMVRKIGLRGRSATVRGLVQLLSEASEKGVRVVLAVPEGALPDERIDVATGTARICDAAGAAGSALAVCMLAAEIAPEDRRAAMEGIVVERFGRSFVPDVTAWPTWVADLEGAAVPAPASAAEAMERLESNPTAATLVSALAALRNAGYEHCAGAIARAFPAPMPIPANARDVMLAEAGRIAAADGAAAAAAWLAALARFGERHPVGGPAMEASAVVAAIDVGDWGRALAILIASPSRSPEWFRVASLVLDALAAPQLSLVSLRIAAAASPEDVACQLDLIDAEVAAKQWQAARSAIEILVRRDDLTPWERARIARLRLALPPG